MPLPTPSLPDVSFDPVPGVGAEVRVMRVGVQGQATPFARLLPLAGGAFAEIMPGRFAQTLQWNNTPFGRLHFAGEQTELDVPGMEAAVQSGERAAAAILAA